VAYLFNFTKSAQSKKNRPMGENSPNLVALLSTPYPLTGPLKAFESFAEMRAKHTLSFS
jgi:hypothetical protein